MKYHLIVYVPASHADAVRDALAKAGAGRIGNYDSCSFSSRGIGRFRPLKGATPHVGSVGKVEEVEEEKIEVVVPANVDIKTLLTAVRKAHPYEEPAMHILPMIDESEFQ